MASFDSLIQGLHNSSALTDNINEDKNVIIVNEKRQLMPGESFDTTIAYEGDINSQIVTFKCIKSHDNHDLSKCAYKELKWKNKTSGAEGISPLVSTGTATAEAFYLKWEIPADACTQAGIIEISISIYDKSGNQVVFSWNTAKYAGLTIGGSLESVGFEFPPKDEILVIDRDTKTITAPVGYNNTICNYGEVGVTEIYFLVNKHLGKKRELDVMSSNITVYVTLNGLVGSDSDVSRIEKRLYTTEIDNRNSEGLVLITWKVPAGITAGPGGPSGMKIMLGFEEGGKKWYSNTYSALKIGETLFVGTDGDVEEWNLLEDIVSKYIEEYFVENNFIIDANE